MLKRRLCIVNCYDPLQFVLVQIFQRIIQNTENLYEILSHRLLHQEEIELLVLAKLERYVS